MCGIAGLLSLNGRRIEGTTPADRARVMAGRLVHRGPDDDGVWASADGSIALSHRRLSIVDLSPLGQNPMAWDGGRLQITFNGEIYNFRELRAELEALGYRFRSQTDTEVILAAYDQWGLDCVQRMAGMFAIALWDSTRRRLWLVRDRLGKKPLYYAESGGTLQFSSELKGLTADAGFPREIDRVALGLYLRYGYVPSPFTIYTAARKLPPAHQLVCEDGRTTLSRYWDPVEHVGRFATMTEAEAQAGLETRLEVAVRQRSLADVPLGAFLSGGIDSSLVAAIMQEQSTTAIKTFTIRFDNPQFNEADHAAAVARHIGTDHYEQTCSDSDLFDVVDRLADMFDEPFADSSAVPTYLVSRIARQRVTVALSGDGGDELFFGYPRYVYHASGAWALDLPRPVRRSAAFVASRMPTRRLRRIADVLRSDELDSYSGFVSWFANDDIRSMTGHPAGDAPAYADIMARAQVDAESRPGLLDLVTYLPDDILTKVDRASMAVSLEVRAPLLDHRVVEFALGLPQHLKWRDRSTKWLLRQLLYKRVPRSLIDRPKMGFGVPLDDWFRGPLRERMHDYCAGPDMDAMGIDPRPVRRLWADFLAGRAHRTDLLWQMCMLIGWARRSLPASQPSASVAAS